MKGEQSGFFIKQAYATHILQLLRGHHHPIIIQRLFFFFLYTQGNGDTVDDGHLESGRDED
jgi:hypothetical protein